MHSFTPEVDRYISIVLISQNLSYSRDLRLLHFLYLRVIATFHVLTVFQRRLERALQCLIMPQLPFHQFFHLQVLLWIDQTSPKLAVMLWTVLFWQSQLLTHCSSLVSLILKVWGFFRTSQFPHMVFRRPKNDSCPLCGNKCCRKRDQHDKPPISHQWW